MKEFECDHYRNLDFSSWIAWLEKQGECVIDCPQNHQDSNRPSGGIVLEDFNGGEGFYKLNLAYLNKKQVEEVEEMVREWNNEPTASEEDIKDCIGMCLTDADEQRFKNYHTNLRDCLAWLEKQGEQKPTDAIEPKFKVGDIMRTLQEATDNITSGLPVIVSIDKEYYHCTNELITIKEQDDYEYPPMNRTQKPTDTIESRFKKGDWITCDKLNTAIILDIENGKYFIESVDGSKGFHDIDYIDNHFHRWTIQDAKDGDVLNCSDKIYTDCPFIFHNLNEESNPRSYCGVNTLGLFQDNDENNGYWCKSSEVKPSTKEQRELLFQKMKEAGYEWDAEKKELKKIVI